MNPHTVWHFTVWMSLSCLCWFLCFGGLTPVAVLWALLVILSWLTGGDAQEEQQPQTDRRRSYDDIANKSTADTLESQRQQRRREAQRRTE